MHYLFPVAGLWLAFLLAIGAYLTRAKAWGRIFRIAALTAVCAGGALFLLWGAARAFGSLPAS